MGRYDCVVLYNAARISEVEGSQEKIYPSTVIREEVTAIEESLRGSGFNPYVLSVDHFTKDLVQSLTKLSPKFVFNLCEEINGKSELEMCVAGLLELMNIPYTGSPPLALGLALNKYRVKQMLRSSGIPVAKGYLCYLGQKNRQRSIRFPVIAKPVHEDGSLGINTGSVCQDFAQLERQVSYIHDVYRQEALVEEYLDGREFNVSVIGADPRVLAISEIDFSGMPEGEPRIVSYRAKWDEESPMYGNTVPICPADISKRLEKRIKDIALRSYQCISCRDYGRIDMRTDADGNVYVLEVNPNPDISPNAGFARAARAGGYSYEEMILEITRFAMERGTQEATTVYAY
jgi:D-alanine-D-alanine ligase